MIMKIKTIEQYLDEKIRPLIKPVAGTAGVIALIVFIVKKVALKS